MSLIPSIHRHPHPRTLTSSSSSSSATSWRTILSTGSAVVLYNPSQHELSVLPHRLTRSSTTALLEPLDEEEDNSDDDLRRSDGEVGGERCCPTCGRPFGQGNSERFFPSDEADYFHLLARANTPVPSGRTTPSSATPTSRLRRFFSPPPSSAGQEEEEPTRTPDGSGSDGESSERGGSEGAEEGAKGYLARYFVEHQRLGAGAYGQVFLCEHVLDSQPLGLYAIKKVAVGTDKTYRRSVLREVEILKALRHENIITYHHAWIEKTRFSAFGSSIDTLHILMQYAPLGSLEEYLAERSGLSDETPIDVKRSGQKVEDVKAAFRRRRSTLKEAGGAERKGEQRGVRLMSKSEVDVIFGGIVKGLGYLHNHDLLHLDLKCSNVLLHMDESSGDMVPRPLISDFGTTRTVVYFPMEGEKRTGNTGTMEYCAPEHVLADGERGQVGKEGDHWALGLILHKLLFFRLPYSQVQDLALLADEIFAYRGFVSTSLLFDSMDRRGFPRYFLWILGSLLNIDPRRRMGCRMIEDIMTNGIREEGHNHYPFEFTKPAPTQTYELTDPFQSLAPYFARRTPSPRMDEEATVRSLETTPNASFFDVRAAVGESLPRGLTSPTGSLSNRRRIKKALPIDSGQQHLLSPSRILPPPSHGTSIEVDFLHASAVLVKFFSLHLVNPQPTVGSQLAVLALALASRGTASKEGFGAVAHGLLLVTLWKWT